MAAIINPFVVISGIVFIIFVTGLHNFLTNNEENGCEMTYMFEYPQYVRVSLPRNVTRRYSRYGLYAYGEGHMTERLRLMRFNGIPVLFIPGNSGSHKQVRSLASVSLRKTLNSHTPFHFDYFTVDLNEEYSALFGGVLKDQRDFVHHCIRRILELYQYNVNKPTSVVLIGHSMGGMVAKGLFVDPSFDKSLVRVIITLVTPHKSPVLALDFLIAKYYNKVNGYWLANRRDGASGNLSHVTLASIGGGHRDILVRSGLTLAEEADVNVVGTAMPSVWLSTDHLCSVWCKELVLVIVRTLFDIVNLTTLQVSDNVEHRNTVFQYHMLQRTAGKRFSTAFHPQEVHFDHNAVWNESVQRQMTILKPAGIRTETHIMIRLIDDPKHEMLAVEAVNVDDKDWVFVCNANIVHNEMRMCFTGVNLSNKTRFLPSRQFQRKFVYLNLAALRLKSFTHVVLRVKPTREMVQLNIDVHSSSSRQASVTLPKWISFTNKQVVLDSTPEHAGYYELALPGLEQVWQAYLLHVEPRDCQRASHHAVATMHVPWSREDIHAYITETAHKPLRLKLQTPKPMTYNLSEPVRVKLVLDPQCRYSIRLQSGVLDSLGQVARFYSPMLLPYLVAILLLTLRQQLKSLEETGQCIMFHSALAAGAKPYYVLPVIRWTSLLPQPDLLALQKQNLDFLLLPLVLYITAYAVACLLGLGCWLAIIFSGHTAHKMALRFLARTITGTLTLSEWAMVGLSTLPAMMAALLIALMYSTCGALSLCVGASFFFLKLCKMYEDYLEDLFKYSLQLLLGKRKKSKAPEDENTENSQKEASALSRVEDKEPEPVKPSDLDEPEPVKPSDLDEPEPVKPSDLDEPEPVKPSDLDEPEPVKPSDLDEPEPVEGQFVDSDLEVHKKGDLERPQEEGSEKPSDTVDVVPAEEVKPKEKRQYSFSELHFNFTTLLLWLSVTLLNVPCVLVWAHSYRYSVKLEPDPSLETSLVLCICAGVLWQGSFPRPELKHYKWVRHVLYVLSVMTLTYAPLSLHHIGPIVATAFVILTLHQLFADVNKQE